MKNYFHVVRHLPAQTVRQEIHCFCVNGLKVFEPMLTFPPNRIFQADQQRRVSGRSAKGTGNETLVYK
jgi:hypothetical protein